MTSKYDDIIHLSHHVSSKHPPMPIIDRAAQFAPFAALTGHDAAIKETARLTDKRNKLGEDAIAELELKLHMLSDRLANHPEVTITYFQDDERKEGGAYVSAMGIVKKIDNYEHEIVLMDGKRITIADILDIEGQIFETLV